MLRKLYILAAAGVVLNSAIATTSSAQAIAVYGAAEAAGDKTTLGLLGASWAPGHIGWQPYASVIGYVVRFDAGTTTISQNVVAPQIGLRYQTATALTQIGGGYSFATEDNQGAFPVSAETGEGPFGAFQWDYWGNGSRALEAIASYGFDTKFLWSRGMALQRLTSTSPLFAGGEVSLFGNTGTNDFFTMQVGPAVEWRFTPAFRLGLAAGFKIGLSGVGNDQTDPYGRLSFLWLPNQK
jgi:hypothetical protein